MLTSDGWIKEILASLRWLLVAGCYCAFPACDSASNPSEPPAGNALKAASSKEPIMKESMSSSYLLWPPDFGKFRKGRPMDELLKDVAWRGNLEMATRHGGKDISAISYGLLGGPFSNSEGGTVVWALFVNRKFDKFVEWPQWNDGRIRVGDFQRLVRALQGEPVDVARITGAAKPQPEAPSEVDPGLTAAWLLLREGVEARRQQDLRENAELRNRYNAARLRVGMTKKEVETVIGELPIASGHVESGSFCVFGSRKTFDVLPYLHYSNILVLFTDGKVIGIYSGYSVPGGEAGLDGLSETFLDLPRLTSKEE